MIKFTLFQYLDWRSLGQHFGQFAIANGKIRVLGFYSKTVRGIVSRLTHN